MKEHMSTISLNLIFKVNLRSNQPQLPETYTFLYRSVLKQSTDLSQ